MTAVLPLFLALLGCEETVVRESTVEGLRKLVPSFTEKEPETFEPLSINIFSYGEKKDSIGEINSYYNQLN